MRDGKFVLLQRNPNKRQPNKWGVVAGRMEPGENEVDAICRELSEEIGFQANKESLKHREVLYVENDDPHDPFNIVYHVFEMSVPEDTQVQLSSEHVDYRWVTPEEALQMDLIHDLDACIERHF